MDRTGPLVETRQRRLEERRRDVRMLADQVLEAGAVERDATRVGLGPDPRSAGAAFGEQRELAEELSGPELSGAFSRVDHDGALDDEEHPAPGVAGLGER